MPHVPIKHAGIWNCKGQTGSKYRNRNATKWALGNAPKRWRIFKTVVTRGRLAPDDLKSERLIKQKHKRHCTLYLSVLKRHEPLTAKANLFFSETLTH